MAEYFARFLAEGAASRGASRGRESRSPRRRGPKSNQIKDPKAVPNTARESTSGYGDRRGGSGRGGGQLTVEAPATARGGGPSRMPSGMERGGGSKGGSVGSRMPSSNGSKTARV